MSMNTKETLNPNQQEAVMHVEGPLLVLAGAGSGKTRIVTNRIVHLLQIGVPASEIVAVTFTNKAAEEMSSRVRSLTKQSVLITTFHSFSAKILRESIHYLGYKQNFSIYDEHDSLSVLKEILGPNDQKDLKKIKAEISEAKNALLLPQEMDKKLANFYQLYQEKMLAYNALDFDDLLFLTTKLFQNHQEVLSYYQNRYTFLLIDEYQDTNEAQYLIAKMLAGDRKNIFVVGDPDQSIYSWRGANIRNILDFEKDFPGAKVITLDQNYRSTNTILSKANKLIEKNDRPYQKNLWSALGEGEEVVVKYFPSDREEASYVARTILRHKIPLSEVAIFYRTNAQSRSFEDALLRENIPYTIVGGLSFYERKEIKDILAFLRLLVSPSDFVAFSRIINVPKRGLGPKTLDALRQASEECRTPILYYCKDVVALSSSIVSPKQRQSLDSFVEIFDELARQKLPLEELIKFLIDKIGYFSYLKEDPETYVDRRENVEELIAKAAEWEGETISQFLEEISLQSSLDESKLDNQSVRMMTVHNSKGLEFLLCFVVGMEEDLFPHANAKHDEASLQEERRLCYVAMTRARKHLYLTASQYRYLWGTPRVMRPSRFLSEIADKQSVTKIEEEKAAPPTDFVEGAMVLHKTFGKGIVRKKEETSIGPTLDVYFYDLKEMKTLALKYAKLSLTD